VPPPVTTCRRDLGCRDTELGQLQPSAEITPCQATMAEGISLAKDMNDMHALAVVLCRAATLGQFERNPSISGTLRIGFD
jgi:hypothetical protein